MTSFEPRTGYRYGKAVTTIAYLLFGPLVWAGHLTLVYGAHTLVCARGLGPAWATNIVYGVTALCLAILVGAMAFALIRRRAADAAGEPVRRFEHDLMGLMALLATFGVAWGGLTAVVIGGCAAFR